MSERITKFDHKRDQPGMMIMHMNYIRPVLPFTQPITNCNLKCGESFGIIIISIDLFTIKQAIYINKKEIKSKFIGLLFYYTVMKPSCSQVLASFMYQFTLIIIQKFCSVHWHHN